MCYIITVEVEKDLERNKVYSSEIKWNISVKIKNLKTQLFLFTKDKKKTILN